MVPPEVPISDPCLAGLPDILTVAHICFKNPIIKLVLDRQCL